MPCFVKPKKPGGHQQKNFPPFSPGLGPPPPPLSNLFRRQFLSMSLVMTTMTTLTETANEKRPVYKLVKCDHTHTNLYDTSSTVEPVDRRNRCSNSLAVNHDIGSTHHRQHVTIARHLVEEEISRLCRKRRRRLDYCNDRQTGQQRQHAATTPATSDSP